ncbi:hypothetical protein AVEN_175907-1 [Araneus ventricosus]|uniref:Uncharacterized protein n=1 Tax=Araneus ventricosus TaxID=182803 RepID=A0A4Y2EEN6_ARAVE|nr:hypothetical protein AVEN_175907-1 [Araneus ventricosus]
MIGEDIQKFSGSRVMRTIAIGRLPIRNLPKMQFSTISEKLDIHGQITPRKWRDNTPHHSNFQPIHLDGSFTEAPCKPLYWSHLSPYEYCAYSSSVSKQDFPPFFPKRASLPLPYGFMFCGFRLYERASLPLPHGRSSGSMAHDSKWITNEAENPNFRPHSNPIFALSTGFMTESAWSDECPAL